MYRWATIGLLVYLTVIFITSCKGEKEEDPVAFLNSYSEFLDSVETLEKEYSTEEWETIQKEYEIERAGVENKRHLMDEAQIAQVEENNERYARFKKKYYDQLGTKRKESGPEGLLQVLKIDDARGTLDSVTTGNLLETYHQFVYEVKINKEHYSHEEWHQVDMLWAKLNNRKKMLEDSIKVEAVNEINKLKVEYGQYKLYDKTNPSTLEEK